MHRYDLVQTCKETADGKSLKQLEEDIGKALEWFDAVIGLNVPLYAVAHYMAFARSRVCGSL